MVRVLLLVMAAAAGAPFAVFAQTGIVPVPPSYATSPGAAVPPVQQQVLENYRSQLQQTQRELLQQNPSGLSPQQIEVNRQLNTYNAVPPTSYSAAPPSPPNRTSLAGATPPVADTAPPVTRHAARHHVPRHPIADPAASR